MKKVLFFLLAVIPVALMAQVNEMFYVPKKSTKQVNTTKETAGYDEWGEADNGNTRDVDEYNRRGATTIDADDVEALLQEEYAEEDDYNYSTRIVRFHNPTTVVVSSPWYYDVYPSGVYYDSSWGWSVGYGLGWGLGAGWYWPHYSHHHWACAPAPPHHHQPVWGGTHKVQARVPSVSVAGRGTGGGRRPVDSVSAAGDKRPVVQSGKTNKEQKATNSKVKKSGSKRERVNRGGSSRSSDNGSTYNRRSSTSVRAGGSVNVRSSSGSGTRSRVGGAMRSSSSSRSGGGAARGGRR